MTANHAHMTALDLFGETYSNESSKQNISTWGLLSYDRIFIITRYVIATRNTQLALQKHTDMLRLKFRQYDPLTIPVEFFGGQIMNSGLINTLGNLLKIDTEHEREEISAGASGKYVGIFYELNKIWNKFRPRN